MPKKNRRRQVPDRSGVTKQASRGTPRGPKTGAAVSGFVRSRDALRTLAGGDFDSERNPLKGVDP